MSEARGGASKEQVVQPEEGEEEKADHRGTEDTEEHRGRSRGRSRGKKGGRPPGFEISCSLRTRRFRGLEAPGVFHPSSSVSVSVFLCVLCASVVRLLFFSSSLLPKNKRFRKARPIVPDEPVLVLF
jgi:hypothetical protein